ncbi:hypothetical protein JCM33374_g2993 [Metschnikowia sp. JCM 33374]|nr:hypothetical protein JCM33374_g2993 [Metschnikowia sp. JCM 33374]
MPRYIKGDLFTHSAKGTAILAHACNPFGSWGGGIAAQFRIRYPYANKLYSRHCQDNKNLLGSCLLIPATEGQHLNEADVLIACLFTSDFECSEENILHYTKSSMDHLARQLQKLHIIEKDAQGTPVVNMPQINSGIFAVPWEKTAAILSENRMLSINVYTL